MKHTQFPPINDASVASSVSNGKTKPGRGFFARVMAALHESRRRQAAHAILQHRHLIHREHEAEAAKTTGAPSPRERVPQIVRETEKPTATPGATMSFNSKLIIAIVVAGFAVLHFIADGTLRHASAMQPTEDRMPLADRD